MYGSTLIPTFYSDVEQYIRPYKKLPQIIHVLPFGSGYKKYVWAETLNVY
jgi:hypothetical protein